MVLQANAPGPRDTGKTLWAETSVYFLGNNADLICVVKNTTLTALRERFTSDHFPIVLNDCTETSAVETVLRGCFEEKKTVKHGVEYNPGTTITVTCNEKQMEDLQSLYVKLNLPPVCVRVLQDCCCSPAALSRACVRPMLKPLTPSQLKELTEGRIMASANFEDLVNVTDAEFTALYFRSCELRDRVIAAMPDLKDSRYRIPENYAMLTAATELVRSNYVKPGEHNPQNRILLRWRLGREQRPRS